jgi:hypothetical protein
MKTYVLTVVTLIIGTLSFPAADVPNTAAALTPGDYLLVYSPAQSEAHVSFKKTADGKLVFSCAEAPASPSTVSQQGEFVQFAVVYVDANGSYRFLQFVASVGTGTESDTLRGAYSEVRARGSPQFRPSSETGEQGRFLLKKLSNNR